MLPAASEGKVNLRVYREVKAIFLKLAVYHEIAIALRTLNKELRKKEKALPETRLKGCLKLLEVWYVASDVPH